MSADTMDTANSASLFVYGILTLFDWLFHTIRLSSTLYIAVQNPSRITTIGFASSAFARHYSRNLV